MAGSKSLTTKKEKYSSDLGAHLSKPVAILLMVSNPFIAILLFALSLYFSIVHSLAHIKRIEAKKITKGETLNLRVKAWILFSRMFFDIVGLGLSVLLIGAGIFAGGMLTDSMLNKLMLVAECGMMVSSVTSTLHKMRRFMRGDHTFTSGDMFRAGFGAIATGFLGCVLFGIVPAALLVNPIVLGLGTLMVITMAIFKFKKAREVGKQQEECHQALDKTDITTSLGTLISSSKTQLVILNDFGDADYAELRNIQLEKIIGKIAADPEAAVNEIESLRDFCETFNVSRQEIDKIILSNNLFHLTLNVYIAKVFDAGLSSPRPETSLGNNTVNRLTSFYDSQLSSNAAQRKEAINAMKDNNDFEDETLEVMEDGEKARLAAVETLFPR